MANKGDGKKQHNPPGARQQTESGLADEYRSFVTDFQGICYQGSLDAKPVFFHGAVEKITGYKDSEFLSGTTRWRDLIHPEDLPFVLQNIETLTNKPDAVVEQEYRIMRKDGQVRWIHDMIHNSGGGDGSPYSVRGVMYDVTQRRMTEEALEFALRDYEYVFQAIGQPALILDSGFRIIEANDSAAKVAGQPKQELVGKICHEVFHHTDHSPESCPTKLLQTEHSMTTAEMEVEANGRTYLVACTPIYDDEGNLQKVIHIATDMTEHKEAELALQRSEEEYRTLFETMSQGVIYQSANGTITSANPAALRILRLTMDQLQGRTSVDPAWQSLHEDGTPFPGEEHPSMIALRTGKPVYDVMMGIYNPRTDQHTWIDVTSIPQFRPGEKKPYQVYTTLQDRSERRRAEHKLKEREAKLHSIFRAAPVGIGLTVNSVILDANDFLCNMTGYTKEELVGQSARILYETDEDFEFVGREKYAQIKNKGTGSVETRWRRKDGSMIDVILSSTPLAVDDLSGGTTFTALDITHHKEAEKALEQTQAHLRAVIDAAPYGCHIYELQENDRLVFVDANRSADEILGVDNSRFIGKTIEEAFPGLVGGKVPAAYRNVVRKGETYEDEQVQYDESGISGAFEVHAIPIDNKQRLAVFFRDITERKKAEEATRKSEERYRLLFANSPLPMWVYDLEALGILAVNEAAVKHYGYSEQEFISMTIEDIRPTDDVPRLLENISHVTVGIDRAGLWRHLKKDGTIIDVEIISHTIDFEGRRAELVLANDVTEQVQAEEKLRDSEERLSRVLDTTPAGIILVNNEGRVTFANASAEKIMRRSRKEMTGKRYNDESWHITSADGTSLREDKLPFARVVKTEKSVFGIEYAIETADHTRVIISVNATPLKDAKGNITGMVSSFTDITERKHTEQETAAMEQHKRDFYRRTILAATEGKLEVAETHEIMEMAGTPIAAWAIDAPDDLSEIRRGVSEIAKNIGMHEDRLCDFVLAVGETTTNAFKHAGGGKASLHNVQGDLVIVVSDHGKGMEALALPELAFTRGYTTARSLGMGYKAILSIADKVYLATGPLGTTVAVRMSPAGAPVVEAAMALPDTW